MKYIKKISMWLIIIVISLTLMFSIWTPNINKNQKESQIKLNDIYIDNNEINFVIQNLLKQKNIKNLNIEKIFIEKKLKKIIIENIKHNNNNKIHNIIINNNELLFTILSIPAFQENGKFSKELYTKITKKKYKNEIIFENYIKKIILQNKIKKSIIISDSNINNTENIYNKNINFKYAILDKKNINYTGNIDNKITYDFYNKNINKFENKNKIKIEYIDLSIKTIIPNIFSSTKKNKKYYKTNINKYTYPKVIQIEYIYINDKKVITNKKNEILKDITHKDYNLKFTLNKYNNIKTDVLTNILGIGEANKNIENVLFNNENINTYKMIETKKGLYILKINKINYKKKISIENLYKDITNNYKKNQAKKYIINENKNIANSFFEENTTLKNTSKKFNLKLKTSKYIYKNNKVGITSIPILNKYLFNDNILKINTNSELIKINNHRYIIINIIKDKKQTTTNFYSIKTIIEKYILLINKEKYIINNIDYIKNKINKNWIDINNYSINKKNETIPTKIKNIIFTLEDNINKNYTLTKINKKYFIILLKSVNYNTLNIDNNIPILEYQIYKNDILD